MYTKNFSIHIKKIITESTSLKYNKIRKEKVEGGW